MDRTLGRLVPLMAAVGTSGVQFTPLPRPKRPKRPKTTREERFRAYQEKSLNGKRG